MCDGRAKINKGDRGRMMITRMHLANLGVQTWQITLPRIKLCLLVHLACRKMNPEAPYRIYNNLLCDLRHAARAISLAKTNRTYREKWSHIIHRANAIESFKDYVTAASLRLRDSKPGICPHCGNKTDTQPEDADVSF